MGDCKYCGQPAGFLRWSHTECKENHYLHLANFKETIDHCFDKKIDFDEFDDTFRKLGQDGVISQKEVDQLFQLSFDEFAEKIINRGRITDEELEEIERFIKKTEWSEDRIDCHGFLSKVIYLHVNQSVQNGIVPTFHTIPKNVCPFILNPNEEIIWIFNNVDFYQTKLHKSYTGGSSGVSIRITKGVYYKVGGHKGRIESNYSLDYIDSGSIYLTTNGIYYKSYNQALELPFNKLLTFECDSRCIKIQLKTSRSNLMKFSNVDPDLINNTLHSFIS